MSSSSSNQAENSQVYMSESIAQSAAACKHSSPSEHFVPKQVIHSPSRRSALPSLVMADSAPRPAGMGRTQLRDWINQWGTAWAFLGLEPGSSMTDVMKAYKKKALVLHPDKAPEAEKEAATLRMSALGNAKEILLNLGLRILHDNLLGIGGAAPPPPPGAPPPSSSSAPPQPEPSSRPGPSTSSSSKAPPPRPSATGASSSWGDKGKGKGPWTKKGRGVWEDVHGNTWEEASDMSDDTFHSDDSWELDPESSGPEIDRQVPPCSKRQEAELSLIHMIQLSLIHRSSLSLIRMRMRKVLAGPHRTHLGQFGIGRLAT